MVEQLNRWKMVTPQAVFDGGEAEHVVHLVRGPTWATPECKKPGLLVVENWKFEMGTLCPACVAARRERLGYDA